LALPIKPGPCDDIRACSTCAEVSKGMKICRFVKTHSRSMKSLCRFGCLRRPKPSRALGGLLRALDDHHYYPTASQSTKQSKSKKQKQNTILTSAGFQPARVAPLAPEASALDHSARTPEYFVSMVFAILGGLAPEVALDGRDSRLSLSGWDTESQRAQPSRPF
jgi:hypothetical protein